MLPQGLRRTVWLCVLLCGAIGFTTVSETMLVFRLDEMREGFRPDKLPSVEGAPVDPQLEAQWEAVQEKAFEAKVASLTSMREVRALTLAVLALACALGFVSAWRMLNPVGLPREGVRRLLSAATLTAGVLRVVDGAQSAVLLKREGLVLSRALASLSGASDLATTLQQAAKGVPALMWAQAIVPTALVAGSFVAVSQYFRSERVRKIVAFRDGDAGSA